MKQVYFFFREAFVINELIYLNKIKEHEEENSVILVCKHFFLDVRKRDILLVTKDLPEHDLYVGMKGYVEKLVLHQKVEVKFFYDSLLVNPWAKQKLVRYESFLIKERLFYQKKPFD